MAELEPLTGATPRLLTTTEAAELLRVNPRTILNWIRNDAIPYLELPTSGSRPQFRIPLHGLLTSLAGTYDLEEELTRSDEAAEKEGLTEQEAAERIADGERSSND
jgi:excisionase family DNA binding protein